MSLDANLSTGIRFNDSLFSEPMALAGWTPPKFAGLFAILIEDRNWAPKLFQPLYFGEFGNNASMHSLLKDSSGLIAAAHGKPLLVAVLPMPFSTTTQRWALRNELIWAYNPVCQTEGSGSSQGDLAAKFSELEKRYQEQSAQVMQLLAGINKPVKPEPRRRIGFMPPIEPAA